MIDAKSPDAGSGSELLAVIDIGSNSGRVDVVRVDTFGHLDVVETLGTPLRLVHELASGGTLGQPAIERTVLALQGFQAIARGAGAQRSIAVATSAVREAANGDAFIARLRRETGLDIEVISGEMEARYGFLGAVYGMPVEHGVLIDIGGGSMQIARFRDRCLLQAWSMPLGALRLSDRFLLTDPPTPAEIRRLQEHVRTLQDQARIPSLASDEQVVGTGGTLRTLARIDRASQTYPIHRLHGYLIDRRALASMAARLASQTAATRTRTPGLGASRFDSIVGGAFCALATLDLLRGTSVLVSGQGLREGIALAQVSGSLPPPEQVRASAVAALGSRFATWSQRSAQQRAAFATMLVNVLDPGVSPELRETLFHAATILDVGRSVDLYNLHEHTLDIVSAADLSGFSHRAIALLGALVRLTGKDSAGLKPFAPLVGQKDQAPLVRLAAILALADALVAQAPPAPAARVMCQRTENGLALAAPWLVAWPLQSEVKRIQQIFAVPVQISTDHV
ncbi:MAG TPA: Ppx/GppA phosphatase family protein [Chloroflexota bacterium]|nr:Ppx/GppA phosphatase family protein [Chloroflexota bacterium]